MNDVLDALDSLCESVKVDGADPIVIERALKFVLRVPPDSHYTDKDHPYQHYGTKAITKKEVTQRLFDALNRLIGAYEPILQTMFYDSSHIVFKKTQTFIDEYRNFWALFIAIATPGQYKDRPCPS